MSDHPDWEDADLVDRALDLQDLQARLLLNVDPNMVMLLMRVRHPSGIEYDQLVRLDRRMASRVHTILAAITHDMDR